jgi:hypothetical protein
VSQLSKSVEMSINSEVILFGYRAIENEETTKLILLVSITRVMIIIEKLSEIILI